MSAAQLVASATKSMANVKVLAIKVTQSIARATQSTANVKVFVIKVK